MKRILFFSISILTLSLLSCGAALNLVSREVKLSDSNSTPINHNIWTDLLQKHVKSSGVDYRGFIDDSTSFNKYLGLLESSLPNEKNWSRDEQFAYWINAYNAFTVKLIIDHYPTKSIKDIKKGVPFVNSVWDIKFIKIEDQKLDLNNIEHGILRKKYADPRLHFAINCASISCPALLNEAYVAEKLDMQLQEAGIAFLNDNLKNKIDSKNPKLSPIFSWFKSDFTKGQSLIEFVNQFIDEPIAESAKVSKTDYDWNLNDIKD